MKTKVLFAICMLIAAFAYGQNETFISPKNPEEIKVMPPEFTGIKVAKADPVSAGISPIYQYLREKVEYPAEAKKRYDQGTEVVQFTVTPEGNLTNFKVINSVSPEIDKEMISVLQSTDGMWKPGYNNNNPVEMSSEVSMAFCIIEHEGKTVGEKFLEMATSAYNKGTVSLFEKDNFKKANKYFNKGINYMPNDQSLLLLRGLCRYELGNRDGALDDWKRISTLGGIDMSEFAKQLDQMKGYDEMMAVLNK